MNQALLVFVLLLQPFALLRVKRPSLQTPAVQDFVDGGKRVLLAFGDRGSQGFETRFAGLAAQSSFEQARFEHFDQAILPMLDMFLLADAAYFEGPTELVEGGSQFFYAAILGGPGAGVRGV